MSFDVLSTDIPREKWTEWARYLVHGGGNTLTLCSSGWFCVSFVCRLVVSKQGNRHLTLTLNPISRLQPNARPHLACPSCESVNPTNAKPRTVRGGLKNPEQFRVRVWVLGLRLGSQSCSRHSVSSVAGIIPPRVPVMHGRASTLQKYPCRNAPLRVA